MACALRACPNTLLMRIVAQGSAGIRVHQDWYCSVGCFAEGSIQPVCRYLRGARSSNATQPSIDDRIGDALQGVPD